MPRSSRGGPMLGWALAVAGWGLAIWAYFGRPSAESAGGHEWERASSKDESPDVARAAPQLQARAGTPAPVSASDAKAPAPAQGPTAPATPLPAELLRLVEVDSRGWHPSIGNVGPPALAPAEAFTLPDDAASLARIAEDARESAERRLAAILLLSTFDPTEAARVAERLFEDRHPETRRIVDRVLDSVDDRAFQPLQARRAQERDPAGRSNAEAIARLKDRPWSAMQATGEPDTATAGDIQTAWASRGGDMGRVWLVLGYANAVRPDAVLVRETYNPGAVVEIAARAPDGTWDVLWSGVAPTTDALRDFSPPLRSVSWRTNEIRLVLDSDRVSGWNEIDAVALDEDGRRHWATSARASSSYSNSW